MDDIFQLNVDPNNWSAFITLGKSGELNQRSSWLSNCPFHLKRCSSYTGAWTKLLHHLRWNRKILSQLQ